MLRVLDASFRFGTTTQYRRSANLPSDPATESGYFSDSDENSGHLRAGLRVVFRDGPFPAATQRGFRAISYRCPSIGNIVILLYPAALPSTA